MKTLLRSLFCFTMMSLGLGLGCGAEPSMDETAEDIGAPAEEALGMAPLVGAGSRLAGLVVGTEGSRVVHLDETNHVIELSWQSGWHFSNLTSSALAPAAAPGSALAGFTVPSGAESVPRVYFVKGDDRSVGELWSDGQSFHYNNLGSLTSAPAAATDSPMVGFPLQQSLSHVFYVADDRHIHELAWSGSSWSHTDVSAQAQVPTNVAAGSPMAGFVLNNGTHPRLYYVGTDGHVYELWSNTQGWSYNDLEVLTGAPEALSGTGMAGFALNDTVSRVYYVGVDSHVHELGWNGSWYDRDVTHDANAQSPASTTALTGFALSGQFPRVYYQASAADGSGIHEMGWDGQVWYHKDLNALANAPTPDTATPLTGFAVGGDLYPRVYYVGSGMVYELWWSGASWSYVDVTTTAN